MKNENWNRRNGKIEECEEGVKIETYLQSYLIKFDIRTTSTLNYCMLNVEHAEFAAIDHPYRTRVNQNNKNKREKNEQTI